MCKIKTKYNKSKLSGNNLVGEFGTQDSYGELFLHLFLSNVIIV